MKSSNSAFPRVTNSPALVFYALCEWSHLWQCLCPIGFLNNYCRFELRKLVFHNVLEWRTESLSCWWSWHGRDRYRRGGQLNRRWKTFHCRQFVWITETLYQKASATSTFSNSKNISLWKSIDSKEPTDDPSSSPSDQTWKLYRLSSDLFVAVSTSTTSNELTEKSTSSSSLRIEK